MQGSKLGRTEVGAVTERQAREGGALDVGTWVAALSNGEMWTDLRFLHRRVGICWCSRGGSVSEEEVEPDAGGLA